MEKKISAFEVRRQFGKVLQEVAGKGNHYVVERHGEPVAVVVLMELYEQWKRTRDAFFNKLRQAQERANLSPEEADELARQAVEAIRATES